MKLILILSSLMILIGCDKNYNIELTSNTGLIHARFYNKKTCEQFADYYNNQIPANNYQLKCIRR